jgi:hypothetical protein
MGNHRSNRLYYTNLVQYFLIKYIYFLTSQLQYSIFSFVINTLFNWALSWRQKNAA